VLAFCKDPSGKYHKVREMTEGSFFGEVSILTGMPRTATITAATPIELLELDHDTLAAISERHPHVRAVLREFCEARAGSLEEIRIRMGRTEPPPPQAAPS
jgi:CRP-like cAMP-binding protein